MKLDYSGISILGHANLFNKDFVETSIIDPFLRTNKYLNRETISNSKPVYCCIHFHKEMNKYSKMYLFG